MRPRVLLVVAGAIALAIVAYAVIAPSALPRLLQLKEEEKSLSGDLEKARADNARIAEQVRVLQGGEPSSPAVLEKVAREELGWVKRDEIVLTGLPSSRSDAPATDDKSRSAASSSAASAPVVP